MKEGGVKNRTDSIAVNACVCQKASWGFATRTLLHFPPKMKIQNAIFITQKKNRNKKKATIILLLHHHPNPKYCAVPSKI